ncbi:NfeD family protein [Propylenella binzhouense]|uniref:NfeD family protein n=1 Tax=Propylenella binzhouense TaxID=2555902 RepID=A0A964T6K3_9HYPH|nr:NfeD family protein [Propylenella binzhouense]MYZ48764.1 NfeD family protein [Propylenella binzhouense]
MIATIVEMLGGWTWWVLGLILLGIEVLAPGFLFLWFGIAAILIGTGALFFAWPWQAQVIGFAVLSVISALIGRRLMATRAVDDSEPRLNEPAERYRGRVFVLAEPVAQGTGRLRIDDSVWRIAGPDCRAGTRVEIVGARGSTLLFEPVAAGPDAAAARDGSPGA